MGDPVIAAALLGFVLGIQHATDPDHLVAVATIVTRERLWDRAHEIASAIANKPSIATQGTVRAIWESLDTNRTAGLTQGLKYCLLANPTGQAEVSREQLMAKGKRFTIR